ECAAASLKPRIASQRVGQKARFRGECAAASLKRDWQHVAQDRDVGFRGECAAASLKPIGILYAIKPSAQFPRRMRRGLIEATRATTRPYMRSVVSAANAPRPH